jgi:hypothetical protein
MCYAWINVQARQESMANSADYQIQVEGKLGQRWAGWFAGMMITTDETTDAIPVTTLAGPLADQAALLGILFKLHNLGLVIMLVKRQAPSDPANPRL